MAYTGKPNSPIGTPRLRDPALYRARAMEILKMRILGQTNATIGKHFGIGTVTVDKSLAYAVREGLTKKYEESILEELVPMAIKVYKKKLEADNDYAAKDVLDKLFQLGDRFDKRAAKVEEISLEAELKNRREKGIGGRKVAERSLDADYTITDVPAVPESGTDRADGKGDEPAPTASTVAAAAEDRSCQAGLLSAPEPETDPTAGE